MLVCLHFARLPMALCCEPYKSSVVASEKWEKGLGRFTMSSIPSLLYSTLTSVSKQLLMKHFCVSSVLSHPSLVTRSHNGH